jgi:hypothetical protein
MSKYQSGEKSVFLESNIYLTQEEHTSYVSRPPVGRVSFIVTGDLYQGLESPWDYLCSTYPEKQPIAIMPELKDEFDAWDAASDEALGGSGDVK